MKHLLILLLFVFLSPIAQARPPAGELPTIEVRQQAMEEFRYRRAWARCYSSMTPNYCMALSLAEKEFCRKSEVTTASECESDVLDQRKRIGLN
jgi:hypothetical protein